MNSLWVDLRYVWRVALRYPGVTMAIVAMLAFGTGGVTAVFNPLYSTLFAPLPYPQPERLVLIGGGIPIYNGLSNRFEENLYQIFSNLTTYTFYPATSVTIPDTGKIKQINVARVHEDFFGTLGVLPLRGSDFKHSEKKQAIVVSNRFWRNELMGADDAIGKKFGASLMAMSIIGIMPESFDFPAGTDIWIYDGVNGTAINIYETQFLGRLWPDIPHGKAAEVLRSTEFKPGFGLVGKDGPLLQSLHTVLFGDRLPILLMLGSTAVLFFLLICIGVMNLLVTQGARRKSEMALRLILGATRRNLVFQLLCEILPLVIAGAAAGLWLSEIASAWLMAQFPALKGGEVVVPVKMAFFAALVLAGTLIAGLAPALYASGVELNTYLKSGDNVKRRFFLFPFPLRELMVGVQLSLALALLTGVGLLVSSMMFHVDVPIRWSSRDMVVVQAEFPVMLYEFPRNDGHTTMLPPETMRSHAVFFQEFQQRLSTMPEVAAAGIFRPVPFSVEARHLETRRDVFRTGRDDPERISARIIEGYANSEGFEILDVQLIAGRHFSSADMADTIAFEVGSREAFYTNGRTFVSQAGGGVIVNQTLAQRFWPEENAVGKMIYDRLSNAHEIVGVVRDFHYVSDNKDFIPAVYYPPDIYDLRQTFLVKLHSKFLMKDFRQRLSSFDSGSATIEMQSFGAIVSEATANTRMTLQLIGSFALLGIVVAGLGVYATTSLTATAWNHEMGIRMAIGAQTWDILLLALWRGTRVILFGLPLGLFLAWILSQMFSSYLFHIKPDDPLVWVISCTLLIVITIVTALIPAIRASRVNPMDALRK